MTGPDPRDIVAFWREAGMARWFARDDAFDAALRTRYEATHFVAARRGLEDWMATPDGALALLLLLDQFPRNLFRDSGHAFATDPLALHYAARAVDAGHDQAFEPSLRAFFYLPWEHSESAPHQARSVALLSALGNAEYTRYAVEHAEVIQRFGRFPHRNAALGRSSTDEEQAWLDAGGGF
ncbi:MAG TPA: DUF924 family protein [Luteimonas sp.]|nr:DUF924 family protein [Luteimonas sp.]